MTEMQRYDRVAASLHWLIGIMMITVIVLGIGGEGLSKALGIGHASMSIHKSFGLTIFGLSLLRLSWRLGHTPPALPETTPVWQAKTAGAMHFVLYALMISMPLFGYLLSSGGPYPLAWFGIAVPKLAVSKGLAEAAHEAHEIGGWIAAVLVCAHVAAALWHQFVQRDQLLARMRVG